MQSFDSNPGSARGVTQDGPSGRVREVPLLRTKLYLPSLRPEWVSRPRLVERLNANLDRKLTIVSAPAGFGKTTLLCEWVRYWDTSHAVRTGWHAAPEDVAWLSLDRSDNDPTSFWTYVIAALQTMPGWAKGGVGEASLPMLRSPQPPSIEVVLTALINEIDQVMHQDQTSPHTHVLVLDDLHLIEEAQIHEGLTFLVSHMPPQLHLAISSRTDPPWPLARWRVRRELIEVRTADLRFTAKEAAAFLNEAMRLDLPAEQVIALEQRTEGWIAGLQMAAISMRGRRQAQGLHAMSGFIQAFTGSHRFILDYLMEEVLSQQPSAIQGFLLKTSILDRLTAPLCDALLEVGGQAWDSDTDPHHPPASSGQMLEEVEAANLFLIPLDDERRWYRYHHLFADLLRSRLKQNHPGQLPALHRRASAWFAQNNDIATAVGHALSAGDFERAASLVEENVLIFKDHAELPTVVRWLDAFPQGMVQARPWLCVAKSWALAYVGQFTDSEGFLQAAEGTLETALDGDDQLHIRGHIAAIRSYVALFHGDLKRSIEQGYIALENLPESDLQTRQSAATTLASALRLDGELAEAGHVLTDAIAMSRTLGSDQTTIRMLNGLYALQSSQGQLRKGIATLQEALQLAERGTERRRIRLPAAGLGHLRLSDALLHQNDLEGALGHVREGIELCKQWGMANPLWEGYLGLAWVLQATGDEAGALDAMREAQRVATSMSLAIARATAADQASLYLAQGNLEAAARWAEESGLAIQDEIRFWDLGIYRTYGYLLLALGRHDPGRLELAEKLAARSLGIAEEAGALGIALWFYILQALIYQAQHRIEEAMIPLERALTLAETEGYVRLFIQEGAPMRKLLQQATTRGIAPAYAAELLAALHDVEPGTMAETGTQPQPFTSISQPLIEPLTERELQVLRMLNTTLSGPEIAEELVISPSTYRSHTKNIYSKLGVHSRAEAIARAQDLNLM